MTGDDSHSGDPGQALRSIAQRQPLLPILAAELFIERVRTLGPQADSALPFELDRKRDAVASALRLVLLNGDMLPRVREVLVHSEMPVANAARSPEFLREAHAHLMSALREVSDGAFAAVSAEAFRDVAGIVVDALFGTPAAFTPRREAA